ncbi:MAG TPA: sensor histidine kinase [Mucilaginibacter sp.]|nr:sensor histidine kinase [Mucilaginibacter sp.]
MTADEALAKINEQRKDYRTALLYYRAAQDIRDSLTALQKTRDSTSVKYNIELLGDVFGKIGRKAITEQTLLNTIETKRALDDTLAMAINYLNLGLLYEDQKHYTKALGALQQCTQYAQAIAYTDLQNSATVELSNLFQQTGDYQQAIAWFKKHQELAAKLANENSSTKIAALQTKYENTQKENRILQQQFEITRRNYWVAGIGIVLGLSLLLTYFYFQSNKLKQQNIATTAIIETEEKERKRIAQDLHDSVSQTMMAAKINLTVVGNEMPFLNDAQKTRFEKAINLVDEGFKEVRTISHNMMPQALLESGLALVVKQFIENIENDSIKVNLFSKGFEEHFDDTTETILYRILQECVNNVLKHADASRLDISLIRDENSISLTIEDNGRGFDAADKEKYNGMGLKNLQNRVNFIKGKIEIDSHPGGGTLVSVYIPLKK